MMKLVTIQVEVEIPEEALPHEFDDILHEVAELAHGLILGDADVDESGYGAWLIGIEDAG